MPDLQLKLDLTFDNAANLKDGRLLVGWFETAKYDDNTQVAAVARQNEYGTDKIPARPFMRPAEADNFNKWQAVLYQKTIEAIEKGKSVDYILNALGLIVTGDIQDKIRDVYDPPLAEFTIKERARKRGLKLDEVSDTLTKPLIDSGVMLASVSYQIQEGS